MDRKHFLGVAGALLAGTTLPLKKALATRPDEKELMYKKPPYLKKGDIIGITSPAGFITLEEILPAMQVMESWGYKVQVGSSIGKRDFSFGGTDAERKADLQQLL